MILRLLVLAMLALPVVAAQGSGSFGATPIGCLRGSHRLAPDTAATPGVPLIACLAILACVALATMRRRP